VGPNKTHKMEKAQTNYNLKGVENNMAPIREYTNR
jgi:hypothetical protein